LNNEGDRRVPDRVRKRSASFVGRNWVLDAIDEPGGPAEAERAVDQHLLAADRDIGADLEVGPAQLALDLLVILLDPVPDAVDPHDLRQAGGRVRDAGLTWAAGPGQVRGQVSGCAARILD